MTDESQEPHRSLSDVFALDGRTAVVTGAASGIGRATAVIFAEAGAALVLADRDADGLAKTARLVATAGVEPLVRSTDVANRGEVEALADAALHHTSRLDVWANIAGILRYFSLAEATEAQVREITAVNQLGTYWGIAAAGRRMAERGGGAILNVASTGGELGVPGLSGYGMTKAAVMHLTKTGAAEFGPSGVRVNAVAPGFVETPMVTARITDERGVVDDAARERLVHERSSTVPLRRAGSPRDIALALLYLASDASAFMTGQTLRPNGGITMA